MIGMLIQWPAIITALMFPVLIFIYYRLSKREENEMIEIEKMMDRMEKMMFEMRGMMMKGMMGPAPMESKKEEQKKESQTIEEKKTDPHKH